MSKRKSNGDRSSPAKKKQQTTTIDQLFARQRENHASNVQSPKYSLVTCPICNMKLPEIKINRHLDQECKLEYLPALEREQGLETDRNNELQVELRPSELPKVHHSDEKRVRKKLSLETRKETRYETFSVDTLKESSCRCSSRPTAKRNPSKCNPRAQNIIKSPYFSNEHVRPNRNRVISNTSTSKEVNCDSKRAEKRNDENDKLVKTNKCSPTKKETTIRNRLTESKVRYRPKQRLDKPETETESCGDLQTPEYGPIPSMRTEEYLDLVPKRFVDIKVSLSPTKRRNGRDPSLASRSPPSSGDADLKYYLRNFLHVIKSVLDVADDFELFNETDLTIVRNFYRLSVKAQKLYVRLFTRKHFWIPSSKMKYPEIDDDLEPVLRELQRNHLLEFEDRLTCLKTILKLLMAQQLKELCKNLNMKNINQRTKAANHILNHCSQQRSAVPGHDVAGAVTKEAKRLLKGCCRLLETPRRVFVRILTLYSLTADTNDRSHEDKPFQLETILRVNMGLVIYPKYEMKRRAKIFRSRDDLLRYEKAYLLDGEITTAMENKDWNEAESLCLIAEEEFRCLLQDESIIRHDTSLPRFLRKFTAGHVYVLCLNQQIELLQRLRRYEEAVAQLEELLRQGFYCQHHRGHWFERIALDIDQHLHRPLQALKLIQESLADPSITADHRLALHQRALRISTAKKNKSVLRKTALRLPPFAIRDAPTIEIEGKKLNQSIPGYKTAFVVPEFSESGNNVLDVVLCSVEEFALAHYRTLGFSAGLHGEGSTLVSLFGLLFWDIIYQCDIPDAFRSQHQSFPLDLVTDDFYSSRKENVDTKLDLILNSKIEDVMAIMETTWNDHKGQSSLVNWNLFASFQRVQSLVMCMGNVFLKIICKRFATNYRHYRAGVPDLVVWKPNTKEWKLVEVKGPGDRLSNKQLIWLDYLLESDVNVEVCYVNAVGERMRKIAKTKAEK